jgi:hypothetical protein
MEATTLVVPKANIHAIVFRSTVVGVYLSRSHKENAVDPLPCARCGGKLMFKDTVENPTTGALVRFFRRQDCGHIHTVQVPSESQMASVPQNVR